MRNGLVTLVLIVGTAALLYLFLFNEPQRTAIPYSGSDDAFLTLVADGQVDSVRHARREARDHPQAESARATAVVVESFVPSQFTTSLRQDMIEACAGRPVCDRCR